VIDPARAVEAYEAAWREGRFEDFVSVTTASLRRALDVTASADFEAAAVEYAEASEGLISQVTHVDVDGDHATVETTESSADGTDHVVEKVLVQLVRKDGAWRVDAVEATDA
jgi:hypothetical protein